MDWHNPLIACVLFLVGGAFFVTSIVVPAWSYNSQNERIGIWDLCYREGQQQCYSSGHPFYALLLRICASLSVGLLSLAGILKIAWAISHFEKNAVGLCSFICVVLSGTIGIAIFAIFVKTFSNINDLTWGGALLIVTSIFILVSGLFGVIVIKTATNETETTRRHKYSAKTPLVCLLQSQNYAYSNEAFKYHDDMTLLKPATANGHGNTRPLHQMSYL